METMTCTFFSTLTPCRWLFVMAVVALAVGGAAGAYAQQVPTSQVGPSGAEPVATDSRPADSLTIERVVDQVLETYP